MTTGQVHSVVGAAANIADVTQVDKLLPGEENVVCADAGYTGIKKREEHAGRQVIWQIVARRSTYKKHGTRSAVYKAIRKIEKAKAQVRAKVEHPFRMIKRQLGYQGGLSRLAKNTVQWRRYLPCRIFGWSADSFWPAQERCACNVEMAVARRSRRLKIMSG